MPHEITTKNVIIVNDEQAWHNNSSFGDIMNYCSCLLFGDGDFHNITYTKRGPVGRMTQIVFFSNHFIDLEKEHLLILSQEEKELEKGEMDIQFIFFDLGVCIDMIITQQLKKKKTFV